MNHQTQKAAKAYFGQANKLFRDLKTAETKTIHAKKKGK